MGRVGDLKSEITGGGDRSGTPCRMTTGVSLAPGAPETAAVLTLGPCPPLSLAVGKPIQVPKTLQPSEREVNQLHQHYINELCKLFEEHKLKFNVPTDQHLEFC